MATPLPSGGCNPGDGAGHSEEWVPESRRTGGAILVPRSELQALRAHLGASFGVQVEQETRLAPDEVKTGVDFHRRRAGAIQGSLTGSGARQDAWYEVRAFRLHEGQEEFRASTWIGAWNRSTTLRGLAPGRYKLTLQQPGREAAPGVELPTREVEVRAQETVPASFEAF